MSLVRLTPEPFEKVWGSMALEPWHRDPGSEKLIGEVWYQGLADSPLLIKLVFTSQKLSVQVHPDDAYAQAHHGSRGKTEMWHVLRADPGARIAAGFRTEISEKELRESAESGEIMNLLDWYEARAGDTFFIPAGTVHAIGEGLVLCEIQQHCDITYRLYDYGRPRELHLEHAVKVSRRGPLPARSQAQGSTLAACPYFTTDKIRLAGSLRQTPVPGASEFWIVLEGSAEIAGEQWRAGEVGYVPPGHADFELSGHAVLLRTYAPNSAAD
jgi:mannose-6-phosphate isomerase